MRFLFPHHRFIIANRCQLSHGQAEDGMHKISRHIAQRPQHKIAMVHKRVRHLQVGLADDLLAEKHNVNVDGAGLVAVAAARAAKLGFNLQTQLKNGVRLKLGFGHNNLIQKHLLGIETPRLRLIDSRLAHNAPYAAAYHRDSVLQIIPRIANISAQAQVNLFHNQLKMRK